MSEDAKCAENLEIEEFVTTYDINDQRRKEVRTELYALLNNSEATIYLEYYAIGDDGARLVGHYLKNNTTCTDLKLEDNQITDVGCKALADALTENSSLQYLELDNNQITDVGCKVLADALKENSSLHCLQLDGNQITDVGCKALADVLPENNSLQLLLLHKNMIGVKGLLYLANICKCHDRSFKRLDVGSQKYKDGSSMLETYVYHASLKHMRVLGSGHYGAAHLGEYQWDPCVMKTSHDDNSPETMFELIVLQCLPAHDNVVTLIGKCDDAKIEGEVKQALVLELHEGGSLKGYTDKHKGKMPLSEIYSFAQQMTRAVQHLHKYKMIHRDLALRNYVLSGDFKKVVLIDFGLAFVVEEDDKPFIARENDALPFRSLPPETLFSPHPFYISSDIWMLGVAFWQMFDMIATPFKRYKSRADLKKLLLKKMVGRLKPIPLPFFSLVPPEMKQLMFDCCEFDHRRRPTTTEVLDRLDEIVKNLTEEKVEETNSDVPDIQPEYMAPEEYTFIDDLSEDEVSSGYVDIDDVSEAEDGSKDVDLSAYFRKRNVGEDEAKNEYIYFTKKVQDERDFNEILQIYRKRGGFPLEEDYQKESLEETAKEENHNISKEELAPSEVVIAVEDLQTEFVQGNSHSDLGVFKGSTENDTPGDNETENAELLQDRDDFSCFNCNKCPCNIL